MTARYVYSALFATLGLFSMPILAQTHNHGSQPAASAQHATHATDDASYVRMMRMHHEQGVKMAKLAVEKAQRTEVKQFAQKTVDDQQQDIATLQRFEQGQSTASSGSGAHEHGTTGTTGAQSGTDMPSMGAHGDHMKMGQQMLSKLEQATGAAFDREFLRMIAQHHKMAIKMSQPSTQFKAEDVREFAAELTRKQTAELKDIEALQRKEQ